MDEIDLADGTWWNIIENKLRELNSPTFHKIEHWSLALEEK